MQMPSKRTTLLIVLVLAGTVFAMRQAQELGFARRNVPVSCAIALLDLDQASARGKGVALRDCARHRPSENRTAKIIGRWVYGPGEAPVDGFVVSVRDRRETVARDTLMHVSVRDSRLLLNDIFAQGAGCAGGLENAQVEGDTMGHVVNMTPAALAGRGLADLSDDPADCAGTQVFLNRLAQVVTLNAPVKRQVSSEAQICFDAVVADSISAGKASLRVADEYKEFLERLSARCGSAKKKK